MLFQKNSPNIIFVIKLHIKKRRTKLKMDNHANANPSSTFFMLKSVSMFLSAGRRVSQLKAEKADKADKKSKKAKTLSKMDVAMGKLDPKTLEMLKRKTHFNK